ncbi:hypothetical protein [Natronococcus wangiae]|uniref:hypothetical protein n=1 Tax=Natronococcus wangiae TaxID=3068275 RepID=UPI00274008A1|nr:hypothetical protein [Natronococcus sp. AD5]
MDRRNVLLGSGAAFAAVLAGCSSTETDDPKLDEADDTTEPLDDGDDSGETDDGNAESDRDETDEEDADEASGDEREVDEADDEDVREEIPGFEATEFEADSDSVSVTDVTRDDDAVTVLTEVDTLDEDELDAGLESGVLAFVDAMADVEAFAAEINTVPWHVDYNGFNVAIFHIEAEWLVEYANGEISEDELEERILETA